MGTDPILLLTGQNKNSGLSEMLPAWPYPASLPLRSPSRRFAVGRNRYSGPVAGGVCASVRGMVIERRSLMIVLTIVSMMWLGDDQLVGALPEELGDAWHQVTPMWPDPGNSICFPRPGGWICQEPGCWSDRRRSG